MQRSNQGLKHRELADSSLRLLTRNVADPPSAHGPLGSCYHDEVGEQGFYVLRVYLFPQVGALGNPPILVWEQVLQPWSESSPASNRMGRKG